MKAQIFTAFFIGVFLPALVNAQAKIIQLGSCTTDTISLPAETDTYDVEGLEAGDRLVLRISSSIIDPCVTLFKDGTPVETICNIYYGKLLYTNPLPESGTYRMAVTDYGNSQTGAYQLYVDKANGPNGALSIPCDTAFAVSLNCDPQMIPLTFNVQGNSTFLLTLSSPSLEPCVVVRDKDGVEIASICDIYSNKQLQFTVPTDQCISIFLYDYSGYNINAGVINLSISTLFGGCTTANCNTTTPSEICANGLDDDGDNLIDCADPDCGGPEPTADIENESADNANGRITVCVNGNTAPYTFAYEPQRGIVDAPAFPCDGNFEISGLRAGNYRITITDNLGCSAQYVYKVNNPDKAGIGFPLHPVLTPNGDGKNDALVFDGLFESNEGSELTIFNRYGSVLYHAAPYNNDWHCDFNGETVPAGTYFYQLLLPAGLEFTERQGYITIIR